MLSACVMSFGMKWEECLPYVEFSYNNSFQKSLKMTPFDVLYGRKCRTTLFWSGPSERSYFGPNMVKQAEDHPCKYGKFSRPSKESLWQESYSSVLWIRRSCVPSSHSHERYSSLRYQGQVGSTIHLSIQNCWAKRWTYLQTWASRKSFQGARCVIALNGPVGKTQV